jgi:predicted enzyme related to lactoylglutathione lyase
MAAKKTAKKKSAPAPKKAAAKTTAAKNAPAKKAPAKKAAAKKAAAPKKSAVPVVHWEIQATDAGRVQKFYAELFGWKIDTNNPMNYGMVSSGGKDAINGGIGSTPSGSRVVVYAQVADINETLEKAELLGAKTMMPRTDIGPVIMAIFEDLEGNAFGLVEG